jgi:hypothetical protein
MPQGIMVFLSAIAPEYYVPIMERFYDVNDELE